MPVDVIEALKEVVSECSHLDCEEYIKSMETNKRLQLETWA